MNFLELGNVVTETKGFGGTPIDQTQTGEN